MSDTEQVKEVIKQNISFQKKVAFHANKGYSFIDFLEEAYNEIETWMASLNNLVILAKHKDTSSGKVAANLLCSLYNGNRVSFNTGTLCSLDMENWNDAMNVLKLDRLHLKEIHNYINNGSEIFERMIEDIEKNQNPRIQKALQKTMQSDYKEYKNFKESFDDNQ